uniref:Uncharacterized protein n=1 Tax=Cucumis melo TaxID=3656 RepID=A0A9I9EK28_CUCME
MILVNFLKIKITKRQKPRPILNLSNDISLVLRAMMKLLVILKMPKRTWPLVTLMLSIL